MIRFLRSLAALVFLAHICLPLTACTTPGSEDEADNAAPIEDSDLAGSEASAQTSSGGQASDELGDEISNQENAPADKAVADSAQQKPAGGDDLESEFDSGKADDLSNNSNPGEDKLEDEIAGDDLEKPAPQAKKEDDVIHPDDELPPLDEGTTPQAAAPEQKVAEQKPKIKDIRYLSNANGGTVVVETTAPVQYRSRMNQDTQQFVIELSGVELPENLKRPFNTKDFNSRIGGINAYQDAGSDTARVVIQLSGKVDAEPVVQQEGTSLVVIPPSAPAQVAESAPPAMTAERPEEGKPPAAQGAPLAARTLDEFLTGNQRFYGRLISLQVKDADIRDVVNFLAEESGANIVMSDDVRGKISLKLRRIPWDQALVTLMRTKDLGYVRQGNVLRISSLKALEAETEAANKIIEAGKALVPAIVQVIPVSYANMDDISKNLTPFLSKDGKILADQRTNTLIVTDKADVVDRVQKIVKTLDIPPAQVSIESKIVEAQEEFERFVGINWGFDGTDVTLSPSGGSQGAPVNMNLASHSASLSNDFAGAGPFSANLNIGTLDIFGNLQAALSLAERDSLAKVISAPRISIMNREKGVISQKGENVTVTTTRAENTGVITKAEKRTPFTLELNVTPQITNDGAVIMDLDVKREFLGPLIDPELGTRAVNARTAKSKILVRNGQTAVIGGIYTSDELENENGIPGLMHIPVLGWLFKNKASSRTKNELLVFLTPRILANQEAAR